MNKNKPKQVYNYKDIDRDMFGTPKNRAKTWP